MINQKNNLWLFREARKTTQNENFILLILAVAGFIAIIRLANWWFEKDHIASLPLFILLSLIFWYGVLRIILIWINYLNIKKPEKIPANAGLSVAIFTTSSPGEPLSMFAKTLEACAKIRYPHITYLLDDTQDPSFKELAAQHGAVWLELVGLPGAKAGKVNKALSLTKEDFILVLDPDHIPFPEFLDEVLGFFNDEKVGFVQVSQAYYNQYRSFTARGAAEQTYAFYGPTQMGLHGKNCAVAIGANCTFRRAALNDIGGHGIGLAEDLITAIRIHAAGWKSIYHPVIVSRGLVPEDFGSFCKQQLKWARGVHEVLFTEYPRLFKNLSLWQRLSYLTIGTYYLVGTTTFLYLLIPFLYFWFDVLPANMPFREFLYFGFPVLAVSILIYLYVQIWMVHRETESGFHWRGTILKFCSWPIFLLGFLLSLVDADVPYIPTAKQAVIGKITPFFKPLLIQIILFLITIIAVLYQRRFNVPESTLVLTSEKVWGMIAFSSIAVILAFGGIYAVIESRNLKEEDPWESVDINKINHKN
jgi:cellulose synthase (UDP-forming)